MSNQTGTLPGPADLLTLNRAATVARLLSGVAHEVNNALQVIGGTTELLQAQSGLPASAVDGLQRIAAQNTRAATAIHDVMIFARQKIDGPVRANLREIAARSVAMRSFAISRARLTIALDAPATGRFPVNGNAGLLQLAILNLIVNAEQALAGQQGGAIRVALEEDAGYVVLQVSDNGPGVDRAAGNDVFTAFFTTRSREEASGLGLSVARLVAEQCGGTLVLEDVGPGATFVMRLPAA